MAAALVVTRKCFISALSAALVGVSPGGTWLTGLWAAELEMPVFAFLAVVGICWVISRGEVGLLSLCHCSNYSGINCDKGLAIPSLPITPGSHEVTQNSSSSPMDVCMPFGVSIICLLLELSSALESTAGFCVNCFDEQNESVKI